VSEPPPSGLGLGLGLEVDRTPAPPERTAACLAILSYVFCSVVGPLIAVWWARRSASAHARRYAVLSLLLEAPILVGLIVVVPIALAGATDLVAVVLLVLWLSQAVLCTYALVLAWYAWRGRDIAVAPVPGALVRRIR